MQRQSERAAAAQKAAQESGIDPKTRRQYEYATRKFAAWLEVHGKLLEGCGKLHRPPLAAAARAAAPILAAPPSPPPRRLRALPWGLPHGSRHGPFRKG